LKIAILTRVPGVVEFRIRIFRARRRARGSREKLRRRSRAEATESRVASKTG